MQVEQRSASKNNSNLEARRKQKKRQAKNSVATNNGRRTEGCSVNMGHSSKEIQDRGVWRDDVRALCATRHEVDK